MIGVGDGRDRLFNIVNDFDDSHTRALIEFGGSTRSQIADMSNVTEETLRGQTKSIYVKKDCHTATDLMQALSAIME